MGTCDALLDIVYAGQVELNRGGELALVQIDNSAAFDRVNHGGLVFKLWKAGVGGLILKVFQYFLSSRTQRVKVDGVCSSSIDVVSGVPQASVLSPLLFLLYIADLPRLLQNELVGYADDSTLLCRIPHPRDRLPVAASLNDDLAVISDWCSRYRLYAAAKARYSVDCRRNFDDCSSANAWWRTPKGHVFGAESDIPPLCSPCGTLVSDPAGKAELLSMWFDSKQSRDIVEFPQTCHPRPAFCGIAFRAREVEQHLLDLDPNGGVDPSGCFPMFFRKTASVLAPKLSCLFHRLLRGGEFQLEWRIADVTPSQRSLIGACLQLSPNFNYTSSVKGF